jgi:predicted nucleic acid-binding Zn ribbon protein
MTSTPKKTIPIYIKPCKVCGEVFETVYKKQQVCGEKCRRSLTTSRNTEKRHKLRGV